MALCLGQWPSFCGVISVLGGPLKGQLLFMGFSYFLLAGTVSWHGLRGLSEPVLAKPKDNFVHGY